MTLQSIDLGNFPDWLREDWEKVVFAIMFVIASIAVLLAFREMKNWERDATPPPPPRHTVKKIFHDEAFQFLLPEQFPENFKVVLGDNHAFRFKPKVTAIHDLDNDPDNGPEPDVAIAVPFIIPSVEAHFPKHAVPAVASTVNPIHIGDWEGLGPLPTDPLAPPLDLEDLDKIDELEPEDPKEEGVPKFVEFKGLMTTPKGKVLAYLCIEDITPEPAAGAGMNGMGDMDGLGGLGGLGGFDDLGGMGGMGGFGGLDDMGMGGFGGMGGDNMGGDMMGGPPGGGAAEPPEPERKCEFVEEGSYFHTYLVKMVARKLCIVEDADGDDIPIKLRERVELRMPAEPEEQAGIP